MAINKKSAKVEKPGYPVKFVELVTEAAKYSVLSAYYANFFKDAKEEIADYLADDECPVVVNIGEKGASPKIEGVGMVVVSQPDHLDNKAAAGKIVELLKEGMLNPDDLVELISTVNKTALEKVTSKETVDAFVKKDENGDVPVQVSVRVDSAFRAEIHQSIKGRMTTGRP